MRTQANSTAPRFVSSPSRPGAVPLSTTPLFVSREPELRMHRKGKSSVASVTFLGETYWKSRAPELVSLEVASQTPTIIKRGFDYMYHKSHGYRLTGGSLYFGRVSNLVRKSQRDTLPCGVVPTGLDSGEVPPPPTASISPDQREKHDNPIGVNICSDSAKNVLKPAPLISLEEARRREVSRRNRAANRVSEKEVRVEREVSRLKREVAEIAWKKAQVKREEEESNARLKKEGQEKNVLEVMESQRQEEGPTLSAAVAAREDGLVVAPTNWIVPLISLDEARHTEKAKRDARDTKRPAAPPSPSSSPVAPVNSLMVNAGNGNTATLQLISLEEAQERDLTRRLEGDTRMLSRTGTGLNHVSLIPLTVARKQDALRRNGSSRGGAKFKPLNSTSRSCKLSYPAPSSLANQVIETGSGDQHSLRKEVSTPQENARWLALMTSAGNLWTGPDTISGSSYLPYTNGYYP